MKQSKHFIAALLGIFFFAFPAAAENFFNGIIVDGAGEGVKGVKVWLTDKKQYTKTDKKGRFGLEDASAGDTLHLDYKKSYYAVPIDNDKGIRIILVGTDLKYQPDEELQSYGYGWVAKRDNAGTSDGISGARLAATGAPTILEALVGLVPGLDITPGGVVKIRGTNSFNQSATQPLYIVDGNYVNSLDFINIHSVDRVEVLKDASIYGSRGAGGAIIVYTKRGN